MRIAFFILFLLSIQNSFAQAPTGTIYGSIVDNTDKKPLEYASILLKNVKDQSTTGGISDEKGKFNISNIHPGVYKLEISYLGYETYVNEQFKLVPPNMSINLGEITLTASASQLDAVEVIGEKSMFQLGGEKKIFNVDKSAISAGGNAVDALKQIPTLDVTMDGNISFRGSDNLVIYINGKPSGMTAESKQAILESLPANSIESIELITNPSSKYDADGTTGIINIVLKKNFNRGLNGIANIGYSTKYKNNAGVSLNFKKNKINFTSGFNYRFHESYFGGTENRKNINDSYVNYIRSSDDGKYKRIGGNINLGLDIDITNKATLSFSHVFTGGGGPNSELTSSSFLDSTEIYYGGFARNKDGDRKNFNNNSSIIYNQKFKNDGQNLMVTGNVEVGNSSGNKNFMQLNYDEEGYPMDLIPQQEVNINTDKNLSGILQVDYTHPFKKHGKLEAGYKTTYRKLYSDFYADSLDRATQETVYNADISNAFLYREVVNALYASFGGKYKNFSYNAGIRSEQSNIFVENNQILDKFKNHYIDFFPSVFLSQTLPKNHQVQLSYSYRINRPHPRMLDPFADFDNPLSIRRGNPYLKPEYINALELTYLKNWKSTFLTASVYFRHTHDGFTRYRIVDPETSVATLTFGNLDVSKNIGTEIIFRSPITKWWNIMLNGNLYHNSVKGVVPGEDNDNSTSSFQWNTRVMSNFKFWKTAELQLSYRFNSKMKYLQGYIKPMHSLDVGLKKDFLKNNRATIAINVQDLFNLREFTIFNSGTYFESEVNRKWESRIFTINFSYKFGKPDNSNNKRRTGDGNMDGGGQMMDF